MAQDPDREAPEMIAGEALSDLLLCGDQETLGKLLEWYRPLMKALADRELDRHLRVKFDSSDVVQQTCQDAILSFPAIRARTAPQFLAWLKTLLVNNVIDLQRQFVGAQKRSVHLERRFSELRFLADEIEDSDLCPSRELQQKERLNRLVNVLQRLPPELRRILRWRFRKQLSYREIGEKVDRREDAVRMLIQRLLLNLRDQVFSNDSSL